MHLQEVLPGGEFVTGECLLVAFVDFRSFRGNGHRYGRRVDASHKTKTNGFGPVSRDSNGDLFGSSTPPSKAAEAGVEFQVNVRHANKVPFTAEGGKMPKPNVKLVLSLWVGVLPCGYRQT